METTVDSDIFTKMSQEQTRNYITDFLEMSQAISPADFELEDVDREILGKAGGAPETKLRRSIEHLESAMERTDRENWKAEDRRKLFREAVTAIAQEYIESNRAEIQKNQEIIEKAREEHLEKERRETARLSYLARRNEAELSSLENDELQVEAEKLIAAGGATFDQHRANVLVQELRSRGIGEVATELRKVLRAAPPPWTLTGKAAKAREEIRRRGALRPGEVFLPVDGKPYVAILKHLIRGE